MPLPNIIKIFQTIKKLLSAQTFGLEIYSGDFTRKRTKQELSFLHAPTSPDIYIGLEIHSGEVTSKQP